MKCETFVRENLPAIRALIAKELTERGMTQQEAAGRIYLTQPAIAFYKKQLRGKKTKELLETPGVKEEIEKLAGKLSTKAIPKEELEKEYCRFCSLLPNK